MSPDIFLLVDCEIWAVGRGPPPPTMQSLTSASTTAHQSIVLVLFDLLKIRFVTHISRSLVAAVVSYALLV
jgi:hypothetical protein